MRHVFSTPSDELRPQAGLAIATIGNRRFAGEKDWMDPEALGAAEELEHAGKMKNAAADACSQVWQVIADEMLKTLDLPVGQVRRHRHTTDTRLANGEPLLLKHFFKDSTKFKPRVCVLTSLAAGADQIAARTALAANEGGESKIQFELQAVLPFPKKDYPGEGTEESPLRKEFRTAEAKELHELAGKAEQVVRLDGIYELPDEPPEATVTEFEKGSHRLRKLNEEEEKKRKEKEGEAKDSLLNEEARKLAYRSAAEMLRQNSDLLVAIYDPFAEAKAAGTLETMKGALDDGMPVVAILVKKEEAKARIAIYPDAPSHPIALKPETLVPLKGEDQWKQAWDLEEKRNDWEKKLRAKIRYLIALPHMLLEESTAEPPVLPEDSTAAESKNPLQREEEENRRMELLGDTVDRLELFSRGTVPCPVLEGNFDDNLSKFFVGLWNWIIGNFHGRAPESVLEVSEFIGHKIEDATHRFLEGVWNWIQAVSKAEAGEPHYLSTLPIRKGEDKVTNEKLKGWYDRALDVSMRNMTVHRGSFVLAFLLAALAAATAVLAMAYAWWIKESPSKTVVAVFSFTELCFISTILCMAGFSHRKRPHEIAVDFRYFAELMRPMEWLARLGASVPTVTLPAHYQTMDPRQGWAPWLFRAIARSLPCVVDSNTGVEKKLDSGQAAEVLKQAAEKWLQSQIFYHGHKTQTMHALHEGLHHIALNLARAVAGIVILKWGLEHLEAGKDEHGPHGGGFCGAEHLSGLVIMLSVLAAALPALAAAFTAILFQSEAARLKSRHEAMYERHQKIQEELWRRAASISGPSDEYPPHKNKPATGQNILGSNAWISASYLRSVAREMIVETGDWHALYRTHTVHAG